MHHFEDGIQFTQMLFNFDALETVAHSDTPSVPYISKNWYKEYMLWMVTHSEFD